MVRVLIGVPTYRRPELLRNCLASLMGQGGDILVVDNDPERQEGIAVANELGLKSEMVSEPGISAVRNLILKRGYSCDFIAMIDDDETASPDWLRALLEQQEQSGADIVAGPVEPNFTVEPSKAARGYWTPAPRADGPTWLVEGTGNVLISTRLLFDLDMPLFDNAFGLSGGGDAEWFRRVAYRGARFAWSNAAVTFETVPSERCTLKWLLRRSFRASNANIRILRLHGQRKGLAIALLKILAIVVTAPFAVFGLPFARWAILRRWARAMGGMAALANHTQVEYPRSGGTVA